MKKNVPDSNVKVKKAVFKILVYLAIKLAVFLIQYVLTAIHNNVQKHYSEGDRDKRYLAIVLSLYYVSRVSYDISALLTPIISIVILKPVLDAIKNASNLICTLCNKEVDTVIANETENTLRSSESTL